MSNPNYYSIIPADVRYSDIPQGAKLLYGEITALSNKEGYCWASNAYFAGLYDVHVNTISNWVSQLKEKGFIDYTVDDHNTRKITVKPHKKQGGGTQKIVRGVHKKQGENNTSNTTEKEPANAVPYQVVRDEPQKVRGAKKNKEALALRERLYDLFERDRGVRPTPTFADYSRVLSAMKRMSEGDIEDLVRDGLYDNKRTVAECLTARNIDIYLQDHA